MNRASKYICVYCGSSSGTDQVYTREAHRLGEQIASRGFGLVYGGASIGIMGTVADAVMENGGDVIGIIPEHIADLEVAHNGLADLKVVGGMHERKALMADHADAFIALPGGFGTLDELFEILTWSQLGIHQKPCGLLNTDGYFDDLNNFISNVQQKGFIKPQHRDMLKITADPEELLSHISSSWEEAVNGHNFGKFG